MSKPSTEKELMHRFQQGDAAAFNTIYNRYYFSLRDFSKRLTCQKQQAEDIAVETFVKLYRLCGNFENVANIRAFLYVTARNACYDYLSYTHRKPAHEREHPVSTERENYPGSEGVETATVLKAVFEAIEGLPEECGRVFKLTHVQGLKSVDIARALSISEQAVRSHRRRSIKMLRMALFQKRLPEAALICLSMVKSGPETPIRKVVTTIYANEVN
jgi:RNA polymerase sigma factor (sigma-70 family)